jgi:hypothetical protein
MAGSGTLITRAYGSFSGVDFRGEEAILTRSPDSLNMWRDYKETDGITTRPSMEQAVSFATPVWGVFFYKVGNNEMMLVHSGTTLYKIVDGEKTELYKGLNPRRSQSFVYNNIFYIKDGINYLQYDGETVKEVEAYVPTTSIGRRPSGGGSTFEDVNMLTGVRINTFLSDGVSTEYFLDARNIDDDARPYITVNGVPTDDFTVNEVEGKITFASPPIAPLTAGQDNVSIKFKKTVAGYKNRINQCKLLAVFDNRVFFSGNPDYPNTVWHSSLNDPGYCSDLDYYNEGLDISPVKAMVPGNNALWVFKEPSQANTTVFYHNPVVDADYGKIYPSTHSSIATGCVATGINFNDDIAFFSDRGMEAINGDITTEQVIAHRSSLVDRRLLSETNYKEMLLEEWEGYLLVIAGNKVYLADSRAMTGINDHAEYEWFYWELEKAVTCTLVHNGVLYLGTEDGIYTLTGKGNVVSYWSTPLDKFKYPQHLKTTNKRGCTVEATGDIELYVKTNKTEWELIGEYKDVKDYFVSRIKRKKFKDIQLKFFSNTRFGLEMATLECYIGGYIKR